MGACVISLLLGPAASAELPGGASPCGETGPSLSQFPLLNTGTSVFGKAGQKAVEMLLLETLELSSNCNVYKIRRCHL